MEIQPIVIKDIMINGDTTNCDELYYDNKLIK